MAVNYSINDIASGLFVQEFDSGTSFATFNEISGWLSGNLGDLNTKIYQNFGIDTDGDSIIPNAAFQQEEAAIFKQLYLHQFYVKKTRKVLIGNDSAVDFITLKEGDSTITRTNKNEVAKVYRGLAKDALDELDKLVFNYNFYQAAPVQVAGADTRVSGSC